jgi:hypothetical protein
MSTTQAYSREIHPPAPVLDIYLSAPDSQEWRGPFQAQLDSGADVTIIPMSFIADLHVPAIDEIALISQWRDRHVMHLFQVDIRIANLLLPVIDVASDRWSKEILLGRNVLNRLDLRLEGPKLRTHILGG